VPVVEGASTSHEHGLGICEPELDRFLAAGAVTAASEGGDQESDAARGAAVELEDNDMRDRFAAALTEILRTAAVEGSHDMGSALRELAASAEALANRLDLDHGEP
jgi:phosphoribosylformylglycinamidine (FGAM) synthase-like enzyme